VAQSTQPSAAAIHNVTLLPSEEVDAARDGAVFWWGRLARIVRVEVSGSCGGRGAVTNTVQYVRMNMYADYDMPFVLRNDVIFANTVVPLPSPPCLMRSPRTQPPFAVSHPADARHRALGGAQTQRGCAPISGEIPKIRHSERRFSTPRLHCAYATCSLAHLTVALARTYTTHPSAADTIPPNACDHPCPASLFHPFLPLSRTFCPHPLRTV
jgi:hypothetical protein